MPRVLSRTITVNQVVVLGGLQIRAFSTSHDVSEPVGYVISDGRHRVGIATDLGCVTPQVVASLRGCDYLITESNHDVEMLLKSGRPEFLIQRILGDRGHLSNDQAARLLATLVAPNTRLVALAHLSVECNAPEKALAAVRNRLRRTDFQGALVAAHRLEPSGWLR